MYRYEHADCFDRELAYKMHVQNCLTTVATQPYLRANFNGTNCDECSWFATTSYTQRVSLPDARIRL